ncbi:hypothetical protein [Rhizobium sp. ZPR3]|uniref:Uncharacterized protein n=2 Tax=unclassified Rhizobium TaxID=2613769 RepID=A0AAU7SPD4_9HYPH
MLWASNGLGYCLALDGADLPGSVCAVTMNVPNAVAQFERDLLIEPTRSVLKYVKIFGRPSMLSDKQKQNLRMSCHGDERFGDREEIRSKPAAVMRVRAAPSFT